MRVAIVADSHFDVSNTGRMAECESVHHWIAEDAAKRECSVLLHAGDLYERKSEPVERKAAADFVQHVTEAMPMVMVRGNHDADGDIALLERLDTRHNLFVAEEPCVCVTGEGDCVVVGCLPWPSKRNIAQFAISREHGELVAQEALVAVLRGLGQQMDAHAHPTTPKVLLMHAMVRGSRVSTGQPLVGCDLEVGLDDLTLAAADFYALGHIHMHQDWRPPDAGSVPVVYPGSPRRTTFGETEQKGYIVATFEGSVCTGWEHVPTPCAPMLLFEGAWDPEDLRLVITSKAFPHKDSVKGTEVRLRYNVDADKRRDGAIAAEDIRGRMLTDGALSVKVEEVVNPQVRARAPEVAQAKTIGEKLNAMWDARGDELSPERRERLVSMAEEL